ncbi:hypothetical protein H6F42_14355 [Pseudanabaena sp. FACHB-1998]|uniref:hypothetical protein n=1 Tax=Pseudanabaena sp. FACHB-1998 TaxID=2692858 RepID=UPI0016818103|nr:hypothetical protein [Pseudanabaena sp. FACHB-1998]MBD2178100.1 hypothetical protein [Pseudanabaena sp. FACHB-1998]
MRPHTSTHLRSFAFGLISLVSISANFSAPAKAQSFPNDSSPVNQANTGPTQYLVYLPNAANIKQAKILAPDAFVSRLDTGEQVVQLGRFNNLNLAQRRASQFSQAGLAPQIRTVQSKFATIPSIPSPSPVNPVPNIPSSNPLPQSSVPIPVESIPIPTSRTNDALPGVPNSDFPNNTNNNAIEIVRSPQPIPQPSQSIPIQSPPQTISSANQGNVNNAQLRYFVIIPTGSVSELQRVQAIAPNAQLRSSYRGTYIEVQGFPDRPSAETLNGTIRRQGFDTRVVFF